MRRKKRKLLRRNLNALEQAKVRKLKSKWYDELAKKANIKKEKIRQSNDKLRTKKVELLSRVFLEVIPASEVRGISTRYRLKTSFKMHGDSTKAIFIRKYSRDKKGNLIKRYIDKKTGRWISQANARRKLSLYAYWKTVRFLSEIFGVTIKEVRKNFDLLTRVTDPPRYIISELKDGKIISKAA